ncbi:MAG: hypothetical protein ACI3VB_08055 [Oscillospiraceae bacterium]
MSYTVTQWLLLFFMYSFFGWIWESCFVSVRKREWVNRGFLYGPVIPIYGFGAIIILWLTLPVRDSLLLIYLLGMLGATALEFCVGALMEKLFHMRWWDYSDKPLNIKGYVCLRCSLGWGCFSLLLTEVIHPPIERLMLLVPETLGQIISMVLLVVIAVDTTKSVQAALDMKELVSRLRESNARVAAVEERLENISQKLSQTSEGFQNKLRQLESSFNEGAEKFREEREQRKSSGREYLIKQLEERRDKKSRLLETLKEKLDAAAVEVAFRLSQEPDDGERERLETTLSELEEFKKSLLRAEAERLSRRDRDITRAVNILKRNPTATSREHKEILAELREIGTRIKNKKNK